MADQNIPINGNYNSNSINIETIIGAIDHLATSQEELVKGLQSVQKSLSNINNTNKNNSNNKNSININNVNQIKKAITDAISSANRNNNNKNKNQNNQEKKKEEEKKRLTDIEINRLKSLTSELDKSSDEIVKLSNKLANGSSAFKNISNELKQYSTNLKSAIDADIKNRKQEELDIKRKLSQNADEIKIKQATIKALEIQQRTASASKYEDLQKQIEVNKKEITEREDAIDILQNTYNHLQEQADESAEAYKTSISNLNKALSDREYIEKKNSDLSRKSFGALSERIDKLKATFKPRESEEFKTAIANSNIEDAETIKRLAMLDSEEEQHNTAIENAQRTIDNFDAQIEALEKVIKDAGDNVTKEDKQALNDLKNNKKAQSNAIIRHRQALENNKQEKNILNGNLKANKEFRENLTKQTSIFATLGDKLGNTIAKAFTSVVEHQLGMLVDAANDAFDAIESTQKSLGKTLKMNSGEYSEFVDMIINAAEDVGTAISSTQALELASTVAEMGVRDENLIKTLAIEQAKIQEAGLTGIIQLNEETIKQYQQEYLKDIQKVGQDQAEENLKKRLDNVIAIEYAVSEEFKSATALANGGFAEIQNYANEMEKAGYVTAENRAEFEYTLARFAQNIENQGGNFSEVLTQFSSLLTNTESDLGAQMLTFLSGNTDKTGDDMVEATTEMLNRYLQQTQSIYGGLNATSLKYVKQAYNDDRTATNIKTLTETGTLEAKTLEDLEISTNKLNSAISDGDYLSATEKMQKKQLDYVEEIAQKMQKIPDGKYYMDAGLNTGKDLLTGLSGFLGSFLGNMFGSSLGGFGTNMSGDMSKTTSTGGLGAFLTGNKATKAGVVGSEITGAAGILYGEAILAKNAYEGYQESGLKGGLVGLAEGTGDKEFARGMGMALGGALGGPVGATIGGTLSAELVPKAQQSFEKLITSGIADPAADAYREMKEAGMLVKESAQKLTDSANLQLQNLETEKKESANWNAYTKEEWLRQHAEELDIDSKTIANLDSEEAVNTAFKEAYEKYFNIEQSKAESELDIAELADKFGVTAAETLSRYGDDIFVDKGIGTANILKSHLAEQGMSITDWESAVNTYMEANKMYTDESGKKHTMTQEYAEKQILSNMGITEEEQQSNFLKTMEDWSQFHKGWTSDNNQFQTKWKSAQKYASNPNDYKSVLASYNNLYHENQPDFVPELETNSSGQFIDEYGNVTEIPSLSTQNHKYYPVPEYKIGLDYVPYDNYLALLHRGETVLNANEAQEYRTDNNINFDTITNTLVSQTDRIETILKQIYTAILTISRGSNKTTLNPNIVNMVSGIATL